MIVPSLCPGEKAQLSATHRGKKRVNDANLNSNLDEYTVVTKLMAAAAAGKSTGDEAEEITHLKSFILIPRVEDIRPDLDPSDISPVRGQMRVDARMAQNNQANQVNTKRLKLSKIVLESGDICNIVVEGNVRAATDLPQIPVVVTEVFESDITGHISYRVASRDGYLKPRFQRQQLQHYPHMNAALLGIDIAKPGFLSDLDVARASALFNKLGGGGSCGCKKGDCAAPKSRCKCKARKSFCTTKCHDGRGANPKCTLRPPPGPGDRCGPCVS